MAFQRKVYIQNRTGKDFRQNNPTEREHGSHLILRIVFYILLVLFVGVSGYVLFFSPYLRITQISIVGTQELHSDELQQLVEQSFDGSYLRLLPKNNYLLISSQRIEKTLEENYRKIRTVQVEKIFPDSLHITLEERKALLVWCTSYQCYLIDENGIAYTMADFNSPELVQNHLITLTDKSGAQVKVGERVLEEGFVKYVLSIRDSMRDAGFNVNDTYEVPSRIAEEIDLKTQQGPQLFLSSQFSLEESMKTLAVILKKQIPKERLSTVAYIDLRTENKAFYASAPSQTQGTAQAEDGENKEANK